MDDTPLCPPYWPVLIWRHFHPPTPPDPDPWPIDRTHLIRLDAHFAALAISTLATRLDDKRSGAQIGTIADKLAANPLGPLNRTPVGV